MWRGTLFSLSQLLQAWGVIRSEFMCYCTSSRFLLPVTVTPLSEAEIKSLRLFSPQGPQETITCEGEKEWIECPQYKVIKINSAFWGRDDTGTCTTNGVQHGLSTSDMCPQDESNSMTKVEGQCKDEQACELAATSTFFDKTDCGQVYKYLRVSYECLPSESRVKAAIQRSRIAG